MSLAYKYRLIDQEYEMAVLDDVLCNVEYQEDGSTNNMLRQYRNNPQGFAFWRKIRMIYPDSKKRMVVDCIHYVSSSLLAKNNKFIKITHVLWKKQRTAKLKLNKTINV